MAKYGRPFRIGPVLSVASISGSSFKFLLHRNLFDYFPHMAVGSWAILLLHIISLLLVAPSRLYPSFYNHAPRRSSLSGFRSSSAMGYFFLQPDLYMYPIQMVQYNTNNKCFHVHKRPGSLDPYASLVCCSFPPTSPYLLARPVKLCTTCCFELVRIQPSQHMQHNQSISSLTEAPSDTKYSCLTRFFLVCISLFFDSVGAPTPR